MSLADALQHVNHQRNVLQYTDASAAAVLTYSEQDVREMLRLNDRRRFELRELPPQAEGDTGVVQLRCTYGHTMRLPGLSSSAEQLPGTSAQQSAHPPPL